MDQAQGLDSWRASELFRTSEFAWSSSKRWPTEWSGLNNCLASGMLHDTLKLPRLSQSLSKQVHSYLVGRDSRQLMTDLTVSVENGQRDAAMPNPQIASMDCSKPLPQHPED